MVLMAQVQTCDLRGHEKKQKDFPNPLDIEATGPDLWRQFLKNLNFWFYGPKRHRFGPVSFVVIKKRKIDFPNPLDMEVTDPDLWHQFPKNISFWFLWS